MPPVFLSLQTTHVSGVETHELSAQQHDHLCQGAVQALCLSQGCSGCAVLCDLQRLAVFHLVVPGSHLPIHTPGLISLLAKLDNQSAGAALSVLLTEMQFTDSEPKVMDAAVASVTYPMLQIHELINSGFYSLIYFV